MAQIVRDRTRHPANRRQPFRIQQLALCLLQVLPHPVESPGHLRDFVPTLHMQRIRKIPLLERAHASH
jgi:hypothetical protein